ncbi:HlyC/CorC family transporter [Hafnia alvei]|uniref:HlyC/CorC family transporter n=1 Tax=Hafnia alvei TaxID=569 RepID=UPI0011C9BD7F|nr:HlyC/CorC family transporter [Hafnia alvei]
MEHVSTGTLITILVIMVIVSAYFSASETGMMTLNRYRLRHLSKQGSRSARRVEKLLKHPDRLISLVLIGNNLVNILASALATIVGIRLYGNAGVAIATGVLTFVVLVFAEVLPKTFAALNPERVAFPSSVLLLPLQKIMMPLVWFLNGITRILLRMFGIRATAHPSDAVSKDELRSIVNESNSQISRRNQDMLISVLDLEKVTVDDILVPRNEIVGIDINDDWKSILRQLTHSPHGRIVLYRGSLDDSIGMLRVREAYRLMIEKKEFNKENLLRAADEIYYIPESTHLSVQLLKFQRNKEKMGIVVDEYGDIKGLVSVEDILEEIVGDFTTSMSPSLAEEVMPQSDGSVLVDGTANIRELNKAFNWTLPADGPRTMNGMLLEELEDIPLPGAHVNIGQYHIQILDVQDNMIKQVRVSSVARKKTNEDSERYSS